MKKHLEDQKGFTLVELLVAAAISILIVLMLGTMFSSLSSTSSRANQRTDAFRDARAALQMMRRDLNNMVHAQPASYFQIDGDLAGQDVRQLYALVSLKNQPAGVAAANTGDVCAVRYYCAWDGSGYSLHRYFRNSDLTIKTFTKNVQPGGSLSYTDANALYHQNDAADEVLALYAWNLRVTAYDASGNVLNRTSDVFGKDTTNAPYACDPNGFVGTLPASIEISFKAISSNAARTVISATANRPNGYDVWKVADNSAPLSNDQQLYDRLIAPYAYDFRTRIDLK